MVSKQTQKKELLVIKMGGSILTQKNSQEINDSFAQNITKWYQGSNEIDPVLEVRKTIRKSTLSSFASSMKILSENLNNSPLLIIHGAGTVGHTIATKLPGQIVKHMMSILNQEVISILLESIPAVSVPSITQLVAKKVEYPLVREAEVDFKHLIYILESGKVPIVYGDMVLTDKNEWAILSGDLIPILIQNWLISPDNNSSIESIREVIMVSDYPIEKNGGLYTKNPQDKNAKFIKSIILDKIASEKKENSLTYLDIDNKKILANEIETDKGTIDKSKGIHGKIEDSLNLVRDFDIRSRLIGLHELDDVIIGKDKGTVIISKK